MAQDLKSEEPKPQSWWQSVPGMLTAAAGVLTATAGLLVALQQVGLLDKGSTPPAAPSYTEGTPGARPASRTSDASVADGVMPYETAFPSGAEATLHSMRGEGTYQVLATRVERRSAEKLTVTLSVRLTNAGPLDVSFGSDSFRLLIDGVPRAPLNWVNDAVDARSAKEHDVVFEVPVTAQRLVLQIMNGEDEASLPLTLQRTAQP